MGITPVTTPLTIRDSSDGCTLPVRVHPGARRNAITGIHDGALKVSLTTPPTDGRANQALIAFLAGELRIPRARVTLLTEAASRAKSLRIAGLSAAQLRAALGGILAPAEFTEAQIARMKHSIAQLDHGEAVSSEHVDKMFSDWRRRRTTP